jgi:predicted DNA-binding transcriptional regulator YafY
MRADRLVATLLLMQSRGQVTAAELARELEVSVATDLTGLTARETQALFLLVGPAAAVSPEVRSALRKLVRALPGTFRSDAQVAAAAVVVDAPGWGDREVARPELVQRLQDAVVAQRKVLLRYASRGEAARPRLVDPLGLVDKDDRWYLLAGTEAGQRTFRVDRVTDLELTDQPAERPEDFDLAGAWGQVVEEVEQRRSLVSAVVELPAHRLPVLQDLFGRHCEQLPGPAGDRVRVRVAAHTVRSVAEQLAGWGDEVEVLGPESVRRELARIGAALVWAYGGAAAP